MSHLLHGEQLSRFLGAGGISTPFGIVLDIDGVLLRGRELLPRVKEAFNLIIDESSKFAIPTIAPSQIIMAHSPLRMFRDLHDKHVLVVGQANARSIASAVGFKNITTVEDLRSLFPDLDCLNFARRRVDGNELIKRRKHFQRIEAIVMLGEPVGWESALQLLVDVLLTSGDMANFKRGLVSYPAQIPVIACNVDLVWMAERSELPRIGHGIFIHCLETLYEKLTGRRMHYEAVLGKPTEISYLHAAHVSQRHAQEMNLEAIKTLYVIGYEICQGIC
ncbi:unnamed protein product [Heligmosomoides polygyrus]|uniref:O-fucosyltransferase family protein n=1 Tax=Heligmosomoides polygyrus TaxID=6339 RepID=A0A183F3Q6_HELPZ|nr:unnamed protein product [Heligmosomoides polygyrus]